MTSSLTLPRRAAVAAAALLAGVALAVAGASLPGSDGALGGKKHHPVVVIDSGVAPDGATLNGATLNGATLNGATLNGATLNGATLNGATLN